MVDLQSIGDYIRMLLIVAGLGAIGGIAYELLQASQKRDAGSLEKWALRTKPSASDLKRKTYFDLGFLASMLLGAIAAVAIMYLFTPEVQVLVKENGKDVIKTRWQIVKVVPLSLIVGSAGGAFLTVMQTRVLARTKEQEVAAKTAAGQTALAQIAVTSKENAKRAAKSAVEKLMPTIQGAVEEASAEVPAGLSEKVQLLTTDKPTRARLKQAVPATPKDAPEKRLNNLKAAAAKATQEATHEASTEIDSQVEQAKESIKSATA